ncbi:MAG: hypothetical protein OXH51_00185 [Gemmatimonadetes bacterium]|nr:hypothetical protein [Gemmatimonadota bacterium]
MTIAVVVLHDDRGMRVVEVPVDALRRRFARSKVGGTLRGVVGAGVGIPSIIARLRLREARLGRPARSPGR